MPPFIVPMLLGGVAAAPSIKWTNPATHFTFSGGDKVGTFDNNASPFHLISTTSKTTGKWYAEVTATVSGGAFSVVVIGFSEPSYNSGSYLGVDSLGFGFYNGGGTITNNAFTGAETFATGDVIGIACDATAGTMWWAKNNTWLTSGNPATGANPRCTGTPGAARSVNMSFTGGTGTQTATLAATLAYAAPSGFTPW